MMGGILALLIGALVVISRDVSGLARIPSVYFVLIGWTLSQGIQTIRLVKKLRTLSRMESIGDPSSCVEVLRQVVTIRRSNIVFDVLFAVAVALINPTFFVFSIAIMIQGFLTESGELRKTHIVLDEAEKEIRS